MNVKAQVDVSLESIANLLCSAFEGGSNYWYEIQEFHKPPSLSFRTDKEKVFRHIDYPLNVGGSLVIKSLEDDEINGAKQWTLNLKACDRGLNIMATKFPHHFANVVVDEGDSNTGDVFLQCCLFGDVIYG